MGSPSNRILPDVGCSSPVIIFMVVDLPDPFGPRYPVISPARAWKLTFSTAGMPANSFETLRSSSFTVAVRCHVVRKETAPGIVQAEPLRLSGKTGCILGNMKQPMTACARRLGAIPFQKCSRRRADANRGGERSEGTPGSAAADP